MMDPLKKIPLPIWIGLGLVLILIVVMANKSSSQQSQQVAGGNVTSAAGPVTTATVGTQGAQSNAGTDQELGNLSQMAQSGFSQLSQQEQQNQELLSKLSTPSGVGTQMQQIGGNYASARWNMAMNNAANGASGQNAGSSPSTMSNPPTSG